MGCGLLATATALYSSFFTSMRYSMMLDCATHWTGLHAIQLAEVHATANKRSRILAASYHLLAWSQNIRDRCFSDLVSEDMILVRNAIMRVQQHLKKYEFFTSLTRIPSCDVRYKLRHNLRFSGMKLIAPDWSSARTSFIYKLIADKRQAEAMTVTGNTPQPEQLNLVILSKYMIIVRCFPVSYNEKHMLAYIKFWARHRKR